MRNGIYKYFLNGKPTDISETFIIKYYEDDLYFFRSIRQTEIYKTKISVRTYRKNGQTLNCQIDFKTDENNVRAIYEFSENSFQVVRERNGKNVSDETFDLPENYVFFPLMRCFQGETILKVAENQTPTIVIVPDIQNLNDIENLLKPIFDERKAEKIGRQTIGFHQKISVAAEVDLYRYFSKHYDENSCFLIDKTGLLVGYVFPQSANKIWEVFLSTDEHR